MKKYPLILCLLLSTLSFSQKESNFPGDESKSELLLRGKALGFFLLEDIWARSFSIGAEWQYKQKFSFAADLVHFRWRFEQEQYNDTLNPDNYDEFSQFDSRNYGAFEFRYFPSFELADGIFRPYVGVLAKVGRREMDAQTQFKFSEGDVFSMKSSFYDLGPTLGFQAGDRIGVDVNFGAAYRTEQKSEVIFHENADFSYTTDVMVYKWSPLIRVNLFWNLSRTF